MLPLINTTLRYRVPTITVYELITNSAYVLTIATCAISGQCIAW